MSAVKNKRGSSSKRGSALIEFSMLGIPILFVSISIFHISVGMWQFQTLEYAATATARYVSLHGATCASNGNACTITVGNIASYFLAQAIALDGASATLTLTDGSGSTVCNPVNSCTSNSTQFPNSSYNTVGLDITVKATSRLTNPLIMYWPPNSFADGDFTLGAVSSQRIAF